MLTLALDALVLGSADLTHGLERAGVVRLDQSVTCSGTSAPGVAAFVSPLLHKLHKIGFKHSTLN